MRWSWLVAPCLLLGCGDPAGDAEPATSTTSFQLATVARQKIGGGTIVRQQQIIDGMPVYHHELRQLVRDDGSVIAASGEPFTPKHRRSKTRFAADIADEAGVLHRVLPAGARIGQTRARKVWYPQRGQLVAAWVVEAYVDDDLRRTIIAHDGQLISDESLVADAAFTYKVFAEPTGEKHPFDGPTVDATPHPVGTPDKSYPAYVTQQLVTVESLNALNDPWLPVDAISTSGNNVDAYVDLSAPTGLGSGDFRATHTGGTFGHTYNTAVGPLDSQEQQMASVTSLFYVINWLHDFWYDAGFDEAAGNAQASNYGRGGVDADVMLAEAQDNALGGSRNNANMATPDDGMSPRMQVFLWSGKDTRTLALQPSGRTPVVGGSVFGPRNFDVTGDIVLGQDGMGPNVTDGCTPYTNDVSNKLVLVDRGNCTFKTKTLNAQNAAARGVIIANNTVAASPPTLGDDSTITTAITIPSISVTQDEGATIKAEIAAGTVNGVAHRDVAPELDGALDSTLIAHEFGHYLHHRLAFCGNAMCRALSEGWGDFTALMLLARPTDDLTGAFPFSVYSTQGFAGDPGYYGIRRAPYSVDFDINALSYRHMADREPLPTNHPILPSNNNSEVHNAGEVWAAALWEAFVALQQARAQDETFEQVRAKMARYVVSGLSLTPIEASPMQARDAILAAVLAASPADHQVMIEAFARRGFGSCAVAPEQSSLDFVGLVESKIVAGNPQLQTMAVADGCDDDSIIDTGESVRMKLKVVNQGHAPLTDLSFTITSQLPNVRVVSPPTSLAKLEPFATTEIDLEVTLDAGLTDAIAGDLALEVTAAGGCAPTVKIPIATRLNVDDLPNSSVEDTFDANQSVWDAWTIAWTHQRETPLDGFWHGDDLAIGSDTRLTSPALVASETAPVVFSFGHRHEFELSNGVAWDGGVIEYSIDNGVTWDDITTLVSPGYTGVITNESGNVLADRLAFVGTNAAWPDMEVVTVDLGTALAGKTFQIRFRIGTDGGTGAHGWDIDDLVFEGLANTPFPSQVPDDGNCEPVEPPVDDPIISGGGGCCDSGRSSNGWIALGVLVVLGRRRRRAAR